MMNGNSSGIYDLETEQEGSLSKAWKRMAEGFSPEAPDASEAREIERRLQDNIRFYASQDRAALSSRIEELDSEWDLDRYLSLSLSALAAYGLLRSLFGARLYLALVWLCVGVGLAHSAKGWCPPAKLLRRLHIRTRAEIDREKYALKGLRGDFGEVVLGSEGEALSKVADTAMEAARA